MNEPFDIYGTNDEQGFSPAPQDSVNEAEQSAAPEASGAAPAQEPADAAAPQNDAPQDQAPCYGAPEYRYSTPSYSAPPKKQRKPRKKHTALRITALALCCVGALGGVCAAACARRPE